MGGDVERHAEQVLVVPEEGAIEHPVGLGFAESLAELLERRGDAPARVPPRRRLHKEQIGKGNTVTPHHAEDLLHKRKELRVGELEELDPHHVLRRMLVPRLLEEALHAPRRPLGQSRELHLLGGFRLQHRVESSSVVEKRRFGALEEQLPECVVERSDLLQRSVGELLVDRNRLSAHAHVRKHLLGENDNGKFILEHFNAKLAALDGIGVARSIGSVHKRGDAELSRFGIDRTFEKIAKGALGDVDGLRIGLATNGRMHGRAWKRGLECWIPDGAPYIELAS